MKRQVRNLFFLLILTLLSTQLFSQTAREFWFVAPEVYSGHGDRPIWMRISTTNDTANINLRQPARPLFNPIIATINPNSTFSIDLTAWIDSIENKPANTVLNYGLFLTSDKPVNAYYEEASANNPELFTMKGKNALGTEFYINGQNHYKNHWVATISAESFDIVATEDGTDVTITVSQDIVGHAKGTTFIILLNKGQTYSARSTSNTASISLAGSHITANHPIAITISDDSIDMPETGSPVGYDLIGDQIIPDNILGKEYIAVKGYGNSNDERVYIEAIQDNTDIYLDGNITPSATINTAQNYSSHFTNNTLYIKSSKPIIAYHLSGFTNEAGSAILPQDSCTGSRQIGFYRTASGTFAMMMLTRNGNQDSFYLDGSNALITASDFNPVAGTLNAWVYARKNFGTGQVPIGSHSIKNTKGKFHLGILNALGGSAEYGFYSDFSSLYLGADRNICQGDSVILDGGQDMTSYEWEKLIAGIWTTIGTERYYTVHDTGFFACMTNGDFCTLQDTIQISYYPNGAVNLGPNRTICEGTSTTFDPGPYLTYLWSTGATSRLLTTGTGGQYWVRVTNNNDCVAYDTVMLFIDSLPQTNHAISGPSAVCQGQNNVSYSINDLPFTTSYEWTIPLGATGSSTTNTITLDFSTSAVSGNLKVHGINSCGNGRDTMLVITVNPLPMGAGTISGTDEVCQGQNGVIFSIPVIPNATSYIWSVPAGATIISGAGTNNITVDFALNSSSGIIMVHGQNLCGNGPSSSKPMLVRLFPVPAGTISGSLTVCQGQTGFLYTIASLTGADSYIWSVPAGSSITGGDGTISITVYFDSISVSGNVTVKGHSNYCGDGIPSVLAVTVNPLPVPAGPISGIPLVCQGQNGVVYSVAPITAATSYFWTVPSGVIITAGAGTNSITVDFSDGALSGNISVKGHNILCGDGVSSIMPVIVDHLPVTPGNITGTTPVCQAQKNVSYSLPSIQYAVSYLWNYSGTGGTITNSGNNVIIDFSTTATSGNLSVKGQNSCGDGPLSPNFIVTVNPIPQVSLSVCNPVLTRDAQSFMLKGGIPLGGSYSGTGVSGGIFLPSTVPVSKDTAIITYHYSNMYNCSNSAVQTLTILPVQPFSCGNTMTDIRDNKVYPTVQIGSQCWMAANLNYGMRVPGTEHQRDNCSSEKYCYNDNAVNCTFSGGLYQWDELMQYNDLPAIQGLCPPAWHLPDETEWITLFNHYISNGFAGSPLKYSGYSGFNALLSGVLGANKNWFFDGFATMFWSSTSIGDNKAWAHGMNETDPSVSYYPASRANGLSVRCLKD